MMWTRIMQKCACGIVYVGVQLISLAPSRYNTLCNVMYFKI